MRAKVNLLLISTVFFWGCLETGTTGTEVDPEPSFDEIELNFFTLDKGPMSSRDKGEFTIRSEFEYQSHFGVSSNGFNFSDEMVVAIYKGEVDLSEHSYSVTKIVERENDILVTMTFEPCTECNTSSSAPYHVIGLDRNNKRFIFEETQQN